MTTPSTRACPADPAGFPTRLTRWLHATGAAARSAIARGRRERRRHRAITRMATALRALDDGTLRDIGLHRSGAFAAAAETYDRGHERGASLRA